jgi:arylsulfatase A-like enzyme
MKIGVFWVGCLLLASGVQSVSAQKAPSVAQPNIVFVEVDDLLYRFMGAKGRGFVQTPRIDALAANGVYFSNAVCQGMMCGPSRNSLITGRYPHNLGFYRNGQMGALKKGTWNLPAALQRCGYTTAWIGKCHVHPPRAEKHTPISQALEEMGFDYALASVGRAVLASRVRKGKKMNGDVYIEQLRERGLLDLYVEDCIKSREITSLPEEDYLDGFYTQTAQKWLKNYHDKKPFFLWLNLSCPHGPHDVPQKYHDMYKGKKIPPPLTDSFGEELPEGLLKDNRPASPERIVENRRGYAAATTFVDTMLGRILDTLKEKGVLENTVVVFFSDHGIFMGNHGRFHKGSVFNEITNPSLIVSFPKAFKKGVDEKTPVELLGLLGMCLDLAGATEEEKEMPYSESILPLLTGNGNYKTRYVFSEIEGFQSCFDGRYRYIANAEKPLLYDLQTDPGEMHNILSEHPEVARRMQLAVDAWLKKTGKPLPAGALRTP